MPTDEEKEAVQKGKDKALKEIDAEREKREKLFDKYQAENYKIGGKFEAWVEVIKHADSPTEARTVIDALIEKERRQALKHARKGLELLQTMQVGQLRATFCPNYGQVRLVDPGLGLLLFQILDGGEALGRKFAVARQHRQRKLLGCRGLRDRRVLRRSRCRSREPSDT